MADVIEDRLINKLAEVIDAMDPAVLSVEAMAARAQVVRELSEALAALRGSRR